MSLFKNPLEAEVKRLEAELADAKATISQMKELGKQWDAEIDLLLQKIWKLEQEDRLKDRKLELSVSEAKHEIVKDMEQKLYESDMRRVEATAKLQMYEKMDTKEQVKQQHALLDKAVDGLIKAASTNDNINLSQNQSQAAKEE